jgi:hypothetical protein
MKGMKRHELLSIRANLAQMQQRLNRMVEIVSGALQEERSSPLVVAEPECPVRMAFRTSGLGKRALELCFTLRIDKLGQFRSYSKGDLVKYRGVGPRTAEHIEAVLVSKHR